MTSGGLLAGVLVACSGLTACASADLSSDTVRPVRSSHVPLPLPPSGPCTLPTSPADTAAYIGPQDVVAEAEVSEKAAYDGFEHYNVNFSRVLLGDASPGAAEIVSAGPGDGALLPPGNYVLILYRNPNDPAWNFRSGRQGIFQLGPDGQSLSALCNNYVDPSHPKKASGELTEDQLVGLLQATLEQSA